MSAKAMEYLKDLRASLTDVLTELAVSQPPDPYADLAKKFIKLSADDKKREAILNILEGSPTSGMSNSESARQTVAGAATNTPWELVKLLVDGSSSDQKTEKIESTNRTVEFPEDGDLEKQILEGYQIVKGDKADVVVIRKYKDPDAKTKGNQFCFFIKPEATNANLEAILPMMLKRLQEAQVTFGAIKILSGPYLEKQEMIKEHYDVIAKISYEGEPAISDKAKQSLIEKYGDDVKKGAKVCGGHQLLNSGAIEGLNAYSLNYLNDTVRPTRLAGGTYAIKCNFGGDIRIVINAFHPYQLLPYHAARSGIVVFEGLSTTAWPELRTSVCGATKPEKAVEGSIRQLLLSGMDTFGMTVVDQSNNGCHMSAGPLEGAVELRRFFGVASGDTHFGRLLGQSDLSDAQVQAAFENGPVGTRALQRVL